MKKPKKDTPKTDKPKIAKIKRTKKIFAKIKSETELVGWKNKTSVEKNIRAALYEILSEDKFEDEYIDELSETVLTIAKNDL